jgi:acyl-CoA thioesterase
MRADRLFAERHFTGTEQMEMEDLKRYLEQDAFAEHSGMELVEIRPGYAKTRMRVGKKHLNALRTVQGGAVFTLADFAFAAASNSHGSAVVALNVSISFVKAVTEGVLTAEAKEMAASARIANYTVNVTDEHGHLVAIFQGTGYRKRTPLGPAAAK